jgi:hypothetical protein
VSDILSARALSIPPGPPTPIALMLNARQLASLARQLRADIARDRIACDAAAKANQPTDQICRRIAATRASLAELDHDGEAA